MRLLGVLALSALVASAGALAKEFPPGSLMVCGATQCRVVTDAQSRAFSDLLWGGRPVRNAATPAFGSPIYQLRYPSGPVGAIISPTAIRVHGLNCGRFHRGRWYRLPAALRGVATGLHAKRLRPAVPHSC